MESCPNHTHSKTWETCSERWTIRLLPTLSKLFLQRLKLQFIELNRIPEHQFEFQEQVHRVVEQINITFDSKKNIVWLLFWTLRGLSISAKPNKGCLVSKLKAQLPASFYQVLKIYLKTNSSW